MSAQLPDNVRAYKKTPVFDQYTVPVGLRRQHQTKAGVWALIHVLEGKLLYRRGPLNIEQMLTPALPGLVQPEEPHEVEPVGPVRFYVEFYSAHSETTSPHKESGLLGD